MSELGDDIVIVVQMTARMREAATAMEAAATAAGALAATFYLRLPRWRRALMWLRHPRAAHHAWQHVRDACPCQTGAAS